MFAIQVTKGEVVIQQGENGDSLYVVESGVFGILVDGNRRLTRCAGDTFGDVVLITEANTRTATAVCEDSGTLWVLDSEAYNRLTTQGGKIVLEGENWLTG